jgi:competence protein ComEC
VRRDRHAVALAGAAAVGALLPARGCLWLGLGLGVAAVLSRWPVVAWFAVALLASGLAQRSLDGLDGLEPGAVAADVTLLSDPSPHFGGVRADVRWGQRRLEAHAQGVAADALRDRLAGEVVTLRGTVRPADPSKPWLVARHVSGQLTVLRIDAWDHGNPPSRVANGLRRLLVDAGAALSDRQRSLYTGLVIGDDREQPADLADDFRGAGLTHLLAVSGQNVAFALALAGPVLRRLRLWPRLVVTLLVIALFGVMTRFEPSVLRASAMAALAATLAMPGHPVSRLRVLGLAVTGLLLVDPLLVRSAGFQLSACAALGIVLLAPRLASALPGPASVREALGVTLAAQLGVAPVLLATFGPVPVASLPANLLGVPIAGLVMVWGLTGGLLAGVVGGPLAAGLHRPTQLALSWLELVAQRTAHAGLGELRLLQIVVLAGGLAVVVLAAARPDLRRLGGALAVAAVVSAVLTAHAPPPLRATLTAGVVRWHAGAVDVVVLGGVGGRSTMSGTIVLEALRRAGVRTIDLLVVADPSVPEGVVELVHRSHPVGALRTPSDGPAAFELGALLVSIVAVPGRLVVDAVPRGP